MEGNQYNCPLREGKCVKLEEAEYPWYKEGARWEGVGSTFASASSAPSYPSNFKEDDSKPDRGYGYSFADHQGVPCSCPKNKKTEGFSEQEQGWNWRWLGLLFLLLSFALIFLTHNR